MSLYAKITKYATFLAILMVAVFLIHPAKAASSTTYSYDFLGYDSLYHASVHLNDQCIMNNVSSNPSSSLNFWEASHTVNLSFYMSPYAASNLYSSGFLRLFIDIPVQFSSVAVFRNASLSYEVITDCNSGVSAYISSVAYHNSSDSPYVRMYAYVYLDNMFAIKGKHNFLADFDINLTFSAKLGNDPPDTNYYLNFGTPLFDYGSITMKKGAIPDSTNGLAGVISEAVVLGIYNSSLDDLLSSANSQLNSANTNLGSIISVLNSIKTQDYSLYNQIIDKIVLQTQNDTALQQAFIQFLSVQLHGEAQYNSPVGSIQMGGPIGEIAARIWYEVVDFKFKFQAFVEANQSEAAEVNSEAASQEQALNDLQESLVVDTPAVENMLDDIALDFRNEDIVQGQSNAFFWTKYPVITTILVMSVSLGLVGFILYGRG